VVVVSPIAEDVLRYRDFGDDANLGFLGKHRGYDNGGKNRQKEKNKRMEAEESKSKLKGGEPSHLKI